ncbi:hypothetical protein [Xanthomonas arboricola]|uniref:hypothetical protein n=1 Tax=Xanthomonas arboricola TaxID=56448 RepID=UPI000E1F45FF|nr:hypothetical protein [Xanthomonas arboricola]
MTHFRSHQMICAWLLMYPRCRSNTAGLVHAPDALDTEPDRCPQNVSYGWINVKEGGQHERLPVGQAESAARVGFIQTFGDSVKSGAV